MSPEKSQQLMSIYPDLFDLGNECNLVTMFGFDCGDGWFDILKECIEGIKDELEMNPWYVDEWNSSPKVTQIKEKYGTLSFYMTVVNDAICDIIDRAEYKSSVICEECGKPGNIKCKSSWYITICDECFNRNK